MTLGEYITQYRKEHELSSRAFAQMVEISVQHIRNIENGRNNDGKPLSVSMEVYKKIADGTGIKESELMHLLNDEVRINPADISNVIPFPSMRTIPLIGSIACGDPITAVENHEGEVNIPDNIHADFALRCKGDSMINARLFDGDIVYIRAQDSVDNGQIAAVIVDGEATLKRVRVFADHIVLEAANPLYQPLVYWEEDQKDIHIIGKAVGFTSTHI